MTTQRSRLALGAASLFFLPLLANAHPGHSAATGWEDGFMHPLQGADHLVTMLLVGMWAAQQRGRAVWAIPLSFVASMALGSAVGFTTTTFPGAETMIVLSVGVLLFLVARRVRPNVLSSAVLVSFFAFFHGFMHGAEIPLGANPSTFVMGFVGATAFLHAAGWLGWRTAALLGVLAKGVPRFFGTQLSRALFNKER